MKYISIFLFFFLSFAGCFAQDVTIEDFTTGTTLNSADYIPYWQSGVTKKISVTNFNTWLNGTTRTVGGTWTFSNAIVGAITGNAGTVTNGVYTTGSYSNPSWITSIDLSKISAGSSGQIIVGNVSGTPIWVTLSGDATISNAGVMILSSNSVESAEIVNGTIVNADINASASIDYSKLNLASSITTADITNGTITNTDINSTAAISVSKLSAGSEAQMLISDTGGDASWISMSGDIDVNGSGAVDLTDALSDDFIFSGHTTNTGLMDINRLEKYYADDLVTMQTSDLIWLNGEFDTQTSGVDLTGIKIKMSSYSNPTANQIYGGYFEVLGSGTSGGSANYAVYGKATGTGNLYAGYFEGNVNSTGTITASQFRLSALNTAPASSSATGTTGEIRIVNGFIYICVATNTWQRATISTW